MKKYISALTISFLILSVSFGQKVFTKNGHVSFFSKTNIEDIKADNNQVLSVLNTQTGELQFSLINKGFHFDKALMEEHFNENYMESEKFPKTTFKGTVNEIAKIKFTGNGTYPVTVTGDMTMHGVTKKMTASGKIVVTGGIPSATAKFIVKLSDFNIKVPKLVKENISQNQEVTVDCVYDQKL